MVSDVKHIKSTRKMKIAYSVYEYEGMAGTSFLLF